jgi:UPF0716 protein FxsA
MFSKLLLLFTIVPIFELFLLIKVGQLIGTLNTVVIVVLTGILGAAFAKSQGLITIHRIQSSMRNGQLPGNELLHGILILIGGVLLVTPGITTDLLGLSLLFPFSRNFFATYASAYIKEKISSGQWQYRNDHRN